MGQVPYAWNALPPLLHLANSYSSFKTQLTQHLLQEAYSDFTGCLSLLPLFLPCPVLPFLCLSDQHAVCECHLSLSPPADCELLEGRGSMSCACLCPPHLQVSVENVGGWD